jgi:hypothetical protein
MEHKNYRYVCNISVAYHYQEVASAVLKASMEGIEKLSVLRVEQCEDG